MKYPPCPGNAPGPFYVADGCCVDCEIPSYGKTGDLLGHSSGPHNGPYGSHCFFHRQPQSEEELGAVIDTINICPAGAIRYAGNDKTILDRIKKPESCDALSDLAGPSS